MYLVDFFKRITRKSNMPVLIYLILNVFFITFIVKYVLSGGDIPFWQALLSAIVLYAVSLVIALSPIGEWILRLQTGCRKIQRTEQINYLMPIFQEVYARARRLDPSIPADVQLFINDDKTPNAFATGRKTICITEGMLYQPQNQIKAALAHEFGHLAHRDTDLILVISVGNLIVTAMVLVLRVIIELIHLLGILAALFLGGSEGLIALGINFIYNIAITLCISGIMWVWTKLGTLLVMKSSRENEYEADAFALRLGYGNDLCALLDAIDQSGAQGLFATLASSHPSKDDRISRLQSWGASYRTSYSARPNQAYDTQR